MTAKSTLKKATHKVARALGTEDKPIEETDILDTLKKEHKEVKALLADLQSAEESERRQRLVKQIENALIPHTEAEEKVVYDAIITSRIPKSEQDGVEGYLEHRLAAETLSKLEKAEPTSPEHKATAKVLKELVEHHIKEEESAVWEDVRDQFDAEARMQMNVRFVQAKENMKLT